MTPEQEKVLLNQVNNLYSGFFFGGSSMGAPGVGGSNSLVAKTDALLARPTAPVPPPVDVPALSATLLAGLLPALAAVGPLSAAQEQAIADLTAAALERHLAAALTAVAP